MLLLPFSSSLLLFFLYIPVINVHWTLCITCPSASASTESDASASGQKPPFLRKSTRGFAGGARRIVYACPASKQVRGRQVGGAAPFIAVGRVCA